MHRNRRPQSAQPGIALLSLVSLMTAFALGLMQNVELDGGIALMGIEGEGDLPLPVTEQT